MRSWGDRGWRAALALTAGTALLCASGATAAVAPKTGVKHCTGETLGTPFKPVHDRASYFLAANGDFAHGGTGWQFTGGASVVADPTSPTGFAAELPPGSTATTPPICVSGNAPVSRMFGEIVTRDHGNPTMQVSILYTAHKGKKTVKQSKPVGHIAPLSAWAATHKFSLSQGRLKLKRGLATVRYQFTAASAATWRIDNLFVDPRMK